MRISGVWDRLDFPTAASSTPSAVVVEYKKALSAVRYVLLTGANVSLSLSAFGGCDPLDADLFSGFLSLLLSPWPSTRRKSKPRLPICSSTCTRGRSRRALATCPKRSWSLSKLSLSFFVCRSERSRFLFYFIVIVGDSARNRECCIRKLPPQKVGCRQGARLHA